MDHSLEEKRQQHPLMPVPESDVLPGVDSMCSPSSSPLDAVAPAPACFPPTDEHNDLLTTLPPAFATGADGAAKSAGAPTNAAENPCGPWPGPGKEPDNYCAFYKQGLAYDTIGEPNANSTRTNPFDRAVRGIHAADDSLIAGAVHQVALWSGKSEEDAEKLMEIGDTISNVFVATGGAAAGMGRGTPSETVGPERLPPDVFAPDVDQPDKGLADLGYRPPEGSRTETREQ